MIQPCILAPKINLLNIWHISGNPGDKPPIIIASIVQIMYNLSVRTTSPIMVACGTARFLKGGLYGMGSLSFRWSI